MAVHERRQRDTAMAIAGRLASDVSVYAARAELLLTRGDALAAYRLCTTVMRRDPLCTECMDAYLACLVELGKKNDLFQLGHRYDLSLHLRLLPPLSHAPTRMLLWGSPMPLRLCTAWIVLLTRKVRLVRQNAMDTCFLAVLAVCTWHPVEPHDFVKRRCIMMLSMLMRKFPGLHLTATPASQTSAPSVHATWIPSCEAV